MTFGGDHEPCPLFLPQSWYGLWTLGRKALILMALISPLVGGTPDGALAHFGLSVAALHERVVRPAAIAAKEVNPLSSRTAAGTRMNDDCIAGLRGLLLGGQSSWTIAEKDGVARTVHLDRKLAIVPAAGNEMTGIDYGKRSLTSKNPKGPAAFSEAVISDAVGFESVDESGFDWKVDPERDEKWVLWYLLHHRTENEVRLELSAPAYLDGSRFPRGWAPRIIIPPCSLNDVDLTVGSDDFEDGGDIDVPVVPR